MVLSGGFVSKAPMYVMRGAMPIHTMTHYMKQLWLKYGVRMAGRFMIPKSPFKPLYFLEDARLFRRELSLPLVYVGGVVSRSGIDTVLDDEGFDFVQMGRALIRDPQFVNRMRDDASGSDIHCGCRHSNYCIARMYSLDMACEHHLSDLPRGVRREVEKLADK